MGFPIILIIHYISIKLQVMQHHTEQIPANRIGHIE